MAWIGGRKGLLRLWIISWCPSLVGQSWRGDVAAVVSKRWGAIMVLSFWLIVDLFRSEFLQFLHGVQGRLHVTRWGIVSRISTLQTRRRRGPCPCRKWRLDRCGNDLRNYLRKLHFCFRSREKCFRLVSRDQRDICSRILKKYVSFYGHNHF